MAAPTEEQPADPQVVEPMKAANSNDKGAVQTAPTTAEWLERAKPGAGLWMKTLFPFAWLKRRFLPRKSRQQARTLVDGLDFPECPRFRNGFLYCVDMHNGSVLKISPDSGEIVHRVSFETNVGGIGWLPDGRMLVVLMQKRELVAHNEETGETEPYADLSELTAHKCNDLVVLPSGVAFVTNFGFSFDSKDKWKTTSLVRVDPDRSVHLAAKGLFFPNGMVVTPDQKTLIVAETMGCCLTAFDISENYTLSNKRKWASLGTLIDGICLDSTGCVWAAVIQAGFYKTKGGLVRVEEGGKVLDWYGFGHDGFQRQVFAAGLVTHESGKHSLVAMECVSALVRKAKTKNGKVKLLDVEHGPALNEKFPTYAGGMC